MTDTLPQWLYWRFTSSMQQWDELSKDDQLKWTHEADAVRRAVARNGFKDSQPTKENPTA